MHKVGTMNRGDRQEAKDSLQRLAEAARGTFWEYLGCRFVARTASRIEIALDVQDHHLNLLGILHGGVHAAVLDNAMGLAAMSARPGYKVVTTNLNIHYLAPVGKSPLSVTAEVIHLSRKLITVSGTVRTAGTEHDLLLACGTGSFRIIE